MKKLLSLLSVLIISGSAMPTVIAANSYNKIEQTKLENNENNKINRTKIVISTNGGVRSSGLILNNKVYFGSYES